MMTCPSCGERAFSAWRKLGLIGGELRPCENCGAPLGLSSAVLTPFIIFLYVGSRVSKADPSLRMWAVIGLAAFLVPAVVVAWIPLWHVVSVATRTAELERRARARDAGP